MILGLFPRRLSGARKLIALLALVAIAGGSAACNSNKIVKSQPSAAAAAAAAVMPAARVLSPLPKRELSAEARRMSERASASAVKLRGLNFTGDTGLTELTGWEYGARARDLAELLGGDDLRLLSKLSIAGGLLPDGTDLATLASSFAAASAGATYSPFDKQIILVSRFKDESIIAHEYVHALQDQHYDLMKLLTVRPFDYDRAEAAFALIEGDAVSVQRRHTNRDWFERASPEEIARAENSRFEPYRRQVGALFPSLLTEPFIFRYRDGLRFVETIRRDKKFGGLDALFARPPVSTEQVLHPEKYLADEQPLKVELNDERFAEQGWRMTNASPLGEIGIKALLAGQLPEKNAARAAGGWGGDRAYLLENSKDQTLFVWVTRWDSAAEAEEFFQAYLSFCEKTGVVDRSGSDAFTVKEGDQPSPLTRSVARRGDAVIVARGAAADAQIALSAASAR